jgi:toxin ParE1/3/4
LWVWPLRGFPYRIVYRDTGALLDVWRVLHAQRDIPAWLRG